MKTTFWVLALGIVFGGALVFAMLRENAPTSGEFTYDDREMLRNNYGGGTFVSSSLYIRCENGMHILYYPDGARLTRNRAGWK